MAEKVFIKTIDLFSSDFANWLFRHHNGFVSEFEPMVTHHRDRRGAEQKPIEVKMASSSAAHAKRPL